MNPEIQALSQALAYTHKKIHKLNALCQQYSPDSYLQKCQDNKGLFAITLHIRQANGHYENADFGIEPADLTAAKAWIKWHLKHKNVSPNHPI